MKRLLISLLTALLVLTAVPALAAGGSIDLNDIPGYQEGLILPTEPQPGAAEFLREVYPSWTVVDYLPYPGLTNRDYAFALLENGGQRLLIGFRSGADGSKTMKYWFRVKDAVPQGEGEAAFVRDTDGWFITDEQSRPLLTVRLDPPGETYYYSVTYAWNGATFMLTKWNWRYAFAEVEGDKVTFYDTVLPEDPSRPWRWNRVGAAEGVLQRDVRYVSYYTLPRTLSEAREKLNDPPRIPSGDLTTVDVHFTGHEQYDVHSGPGANYLRGAGGRAVVSTNGWIQVFGQKDGWVMIQYAIDDDHYRIGWIRAESLPEDAWVPTLSFQNTPVDLIARANLTDDPLNSGSSLGAIPAGEVTLLAEMDGWAYIEAVVSGQPARGFVRESLLTPAVGK